MRPAFVVVDVAADGVERLKCPVVAPPWLTCREAGEEAIHATLQVEVKAWDIGLVNRRHLNQVQHGHHFSWRKFRRRADKDTGFKSLMLRETVNITMLKSEVIQSRSNPRNGGIERGFAVKLAPVGCAWAPPPVDMIQAVPVVRLAAIRT
eukprot:SAG11_NODE_1541_length_4721_cov_6.831458_5_plen_150_part_00